MLFGAFWYLINKQQIGFEINGGLIIKIWGMKKIIQLKRGEKQTVKALSQIVNNYMFKLLFLLIVVASKSIFAQTTVTYIMQDANFPTQFNDGGDFYNNGIGELGMWANSGSKNTVAWRTFKTDGVNSGSNRALQVGDVFKINVAATRAFGQIGFSLNSGGTQGSNYGNRISGSRLYFNTDSYAAWYVNRNGGNTSLSYVPIQSSYKDYIFNIRITSSNTADVYLTVAGTDYPAYNLTMNGSGNIDAFSIYGSDMWDGDSNDDAYWKQTCSVTNSQRVELGYFLASGTYTPGLISNGLNAASTTTLSINEVIVGGNSGSSVVFNQANTYTGATRVNPNAKLTVASGGTLGIGSDVYLSLNGTLEINTNTTVASLRETGTSDGGTAAIANGMTLTINGADKGTFYQNSISGLGSLKLAGSGTTILSLYGNQSYTGTTTIEGGTLSTSVNMASSLISVFNGATLSLTDNSTLNSLTLESGSTLNIATGKTLTINGTLTIKGSYTISGGGTLAYGSTGILKYEGSAITATSDDVFPTSSGPKDLYILDVAAVGISIHANRTLLGALTISANEKFIIPSSKSLTVNGTLTNSAGNGGLVIKSDATGTGSLIHSTSGISATVERYVSGGWSAWNSGWHQISSPVADQTISSFSTTGANNNYDFYGWDEPTNTWKNYKDDGFSAWNGGTNFNVGQGYLISYESTQTGKSFTGALNTASVTKTNLAKTGAATYAGFHLLGNPFASAVKWGTGDWALSNVSGIAKIWNEGNKSYSDISANGYIPSAQGFMVQVSSSTNSITIPTASREHNTTAWYKSVNDLTRFFLIASENEGNSAQESQILINASATELFDFDYDSRFLAGYAPQFYSIAGDEMLSTNALPALPAETVIPFGFVKNDAGSFSIGMQEQLDGYIVYLTDLQTGQEFNLTDNGSYNFTATAGDDPNRFLLHFAPVSVAKPAVADASVIYTFGGNIFISNAPAQSEIRVSNLMGQVILRTSANGNGLTTINAASLPEGIYVVSVVSGNQVVSKKVSIR